MNKNYNSYEALNRYVMKENYYELCVNNSDLVYKVDKDDFEYAKTIIWFADKTNDGLHYLTAMSKPDEEGKRVHLLYHREVMREGIEDFERENDDYSKMIIVDHRNGDALDNRRENLRVGTQSENNMNKKIQSNNTSGIAGVSWHKKQRMWNVKIGYKGKEINLGSYYYMRNAVRARVKGEDEYFGEHSFKQRDDKYREKIESILSLPDIDEPIIPTKKTNLGLHGVGFYGGRYIAYFEGKTKKSVNFEVAFQWRKEMENKHWGDRLVLTDENREDRLI